MIRLVDLTLLKKGGKNMTAGLISSVPLDEAVEVIVKYCRTLDKII